MQVAASSPAPRDIVHKQLDRIAVMACLVGTGSKALA